MFESHPPLSTVSARGVAGALFIAIFASGVAGALLMHIGALQVLLQSVRFTGMGVRLRKLLWQEDGVGGWGEAGVLSPTTVVAWFPVAAGTAVARRLESHGRPLL